MGSNTGRAIYTDGGVYEKDRIVKWAFIVVDADKEIHSEQGDLPYSGNHNANVENAEAEAICRAVDWAKEHGANYILNSDSQAMLDKIRGVVSNATRHPHVAHIRTIVDFMNSTPFPMSMTLRYCKRRSNKWSQLVDDMVEK